MKVTKEQKIGTYFKKENIFIGTLLRTVEDSGEETKEVLRTKTDGKQVAEHGGLLDMLIAQGAITSSTTEVFSEVLYKEDKGYTRFLVEGNETIVGDNSDGKGIIKNIVSAWDYFDENQLEEIMIDDMFWVISALDSAPIKKYEEKYEEFRNS